jgi:hypothetical protein
MYADFCGFRTHVQKDDYCACSPSFVMLKGRLPFFSCLFYSIIQLHPKSFWSESSIQCQDFFPVVRIGSTSTPSSTRGCCSSPRLGPMWETHSFVGEGVGGPNSDQGTDTLILLMLVPQLCQLHRQEKYTIGFWLVIYASYLSFWPIVSLNILGRW